MTLATPLDILDIRHFNARQLRPLLEQEAVFWKERLRWDYRSATELLLQYLDSRVLPGFVALDRGRICGFTFCVYEGNKAVVGDAYALAAAGSSALQITRLLLTHLLEVLLHSPTITRIESQLLLLEEGATRAVFADAGFTSYPRLFMECNLAASPIDTRRLYAGKLDKLLGPQGNLVIRRWSGTYYQAAAELILTCYRGHLDALINDQYRSLHGSLRFLHNIVRFPGCGLFDPEASWLLHDAHTGALAGMVLCSQVSDHVAHITQLCIDPKFRGAGLGRILLEHCMSNLTQSNHAAITLTVTEENAPAVRLYRELGFSTRHRFEAMVLERPESFESFESSESSEQPEPDAEPSH